VDSSWKAPLVHMEWAPVLGSISLYSAHSCIQVACYEACTSFLWCWPTPLWPAQGEWQSEIGRMGNLVWAHHGPWLETIFKAWEFIIPPGLDLPYSGPLRIIVGDFSKRKAILSQFLSFKQYLAPFRFQPSLVTFKYYLFSMYCHIIGGQI
jgi:hypothetical protein